MTNVDQAMKFDDDRDTAWDAVHDATPPGWFVGRPSYHDERHEWAMYAFDPREGCGGRRQVEGVDSHRHDRARRARRDGALPAGDRRRAGASLTG